MILDRYPGERRIADRRAAPGAGVREREFRGALAWTAHEIKAPLLASRLALNDVLSAGEVGTADRRLLSKSERALEQLSREINLILSWASTEGRGPVDEAVVDLRETVEAAVDWSVAQDERHRIALDLSEGICVRGDRLQLRGAIANVLRNALDYAEACAPVTVTVRTDGREAVLVVSNRGTVSPDEQSSIFKPFVRGTAARSGHGGCGLGLYIASRVVQAHGGMIEVASKDHLTSFTICLPLSAVDPQRRLE